MRGKIGIIKTDGFFYGVNFGHLKTRQKGLLKHQPYDVIPTFIALPNY